MASFNDTSAFAHSQSRKQLPSNPGINPELELALASRLVNKQTASTIGSHSYTPFFREYSLLAEYNLLKEKSPRGIYTVPNADNSGEWNGIIFIRKGIYSGAALPFSLRIPERYPDDETLPVLFFQPPVFHPQVDSNTGEVDIRHQRAFNPWRRNTCHLWQLLVYARRILYKPSGTSSPLNEEAARLFTSNPAEFARLAQESIAKCRPRFLPDCDGEANGGTQSPDLFAVDESSTDRIRFPSLSDEEFEKQKTQMLRSSNSLKDGNIAPTPTPNEVPSGCTTSFSWVKNGSLQVFSSNSSAIT